MLSIFAFQVALRGMNLCILVVNIKRWTVSACIVTEVRVFSYAYISLVNWLHIKGQWLWCLFLAISVH